MFRWVFRNVSLVGRIRDVNLTISSRVTAVLGPNGSGKTTLLKLAAGLLKPSSGEVLRPESVGASLQNPYLGFSSHTVIEDLTLCAGSRDEALRILREAGLEHLAGRSPFTLSMGEARIISVLAAISWNPEGLVIDEPTSGLDQRYRRWLARLIDSLRIPVLIAGHDIDFAASVAQEAIIMKRGTVLLHSNVDKILSSEVLDRVGLEPGPIMKKALKLGLSPSRVARCVFLGSEG